MVLAVVRMFNIMMLDKLMVIRWSVNIGLMVGLVVTMVDSMVRVTKFKQRISVDFMDSRLVMHIFMTMH